MGTKIQDIQMIWEIWDVVEFVNGFFDDAISTNTSDIHIEPTKEFLLIRFREDWDFVIKYKLNNKNIPTIITRLKVLAALKIDENKKPQDWKISYASKKLNEAIDVRVSTLPTTYWEKVCMRILRQDYSLIDIDKLAFLPVNKQKILEVLKSKHWITLVAWPTGSWKSTTLFWVLRKFDPLEYNISTLEDPVEYNINFVNQSQIRPDIWFSFASWLRSLVRQDPDIIMVWEIRDKETVLLAIEAALTWHLVLSTIHTNSAAATVQRLINMWIEPFLIVSALKMIISQRLVKKICQNCKVEHKIENPKILDQVKIYMAGVLAEDVSQLKFYKWTGCDACNNSGTKWRMWVHEILVLWEFLEDAILNKDSASKIFEIAKQHWMISVMQDWILKAAMWEITLESAFELV